LSNCFNKIINTFFAKTINEKDWFVIATGMLNRPISNNSFMKT